MKGLLALLASVSLIGCASSSSTSEPSQAANGGAGSGGMGAGGTSGGSGGSSTLPDGGLQPDGAPVTGGSIGMVVIDVQEAFVGTASNPDMPALIDRTKTLFELATQKNLPFFVTFEDSQVGDHALHAPLKAVLPAQAQLFTKTTFDATGQSAFADAVKTSNLTHLVVMGAETDVCVMQTVLGLRKLGFTVLLEQDAVMSEEPNVSPALRRMQQAGALLVNQPDSAGYVAQPNTLPAGNTAPVRTLKPLNVGLLFNDFTDAALAASPDPMTSQKSARLRELLYVSDWFSLPVYSDSPSLPASFASYFKGQLRPTSQIASDASTEQLVVAGTDNSLADLMSAWKGTHELFVIEDALLASVTPDAQKQLLAPFYEQGLVPTTYKSFYYEMTHSVNPAEWPSASWLQKYDEYFWLTQAPEDLPPLS